MAEFVSFDPAVEVSGEVVAAFVAGFPQDFKKSGLEILVERGISSPRPGEFYPLQRLLDAMKQIGNRYSDQMLFRVGQQIALHAKLPPDIDSLEKSLASIDVAYHMNHRRGDIGHYVYSSGENTGSGMHRATMVCANPYPCAFDRGCIEGFAERFKPPQCIDVVVRHDDSRPCRRHGGDSCTHVISWI
jgi:hypothetical protein